MITKTSTILAIGSTVRFHGGGIGRIFGYSSCTVPQYMICTVSGHELTVDMADCSELKAREIIMPAISEAWDSLSKDGKLEIISKLSELADSATEMSMLLFIEVLAAEVKQEFK